MEDDHWIHELEEAAEGFKITLQGEQLDRSQVIRLVAVVAKITQAIGLSGAIKKN